MFPLLPSIAFVAFFRRVGMASSPGVHSCRPVEFSNNELGRNAISKQFLTPSWVAVLEAIILGERGIGRFSGI